MTIITKLPGIIVDIDGTIADSRHREHFVRKSPKNWDGFFAAMSHDTPIQNTVDLMRWRSVTHAIILVTGRAEEFKEETITWLAKYDVPFTNLFMRPDDNREPDTVIKERIYRQEIEPKYTISLVLEDRDSVVKMWRSIGLQCWQVADGAF